MTAKKQPDLTPTEQLILEVLIARFRLGESIWPFDLRNAAALRRLESRGLINRMGGNVENTERAWLTEKALIEHGPSWFQMETTERYLPANHVNSWCKGDLERLSELPQSVPETDPRAINAAHLLIIRMMGLHLPVFRVGAGPDGGVTMFKSLTTIQIAPGGLTYRLLHQGARPRTTTDRSEVLHFASRAPR